MYKLLIIILTLFLLGCNNTLNEMDKVLEDYNEQLNETNDYLKEKNDGNDELEQKVIEQYVIKHR